MPARRGWVILMTFLLAGCASLPGSPDDAAGQGGRETDPRNFTWIKEGAMAIGGGGLSEEDARFLDEAGFTAVANFRAEHQDPTDLLHQLGFETLYVPVEHGTDTNKTHLRTFVDWAVSMEAQGRVIYVHCTNGWHRSAAGVVAYEMKTTGRDFDELAKQAVARRNGTVMRALPGLLDYRQELLGGPQLHVILLANQSRPADHSQRMMAAVDVLDDQGRPLRGAKVRVWSEESDFEVVQETDASGHIAFEYIPPTPRHEMDHLYARAHHADYLDGADVVELFYQSWGYYSRTLVPKVESRADGIAVELRQPNGEHVRGRAYATTPEGEFAFERTGTGYAFLPVSMKSFPIEVHAVSWGSSSARVLVQANGAS